MFLILAAVASHEPNMPYFGRKTLVSLIHLYRHYLSGRGPCRSVVCTFQGSESCSAYALRVADTLATSLPEALRLIRARLRLCRQASLYRLPDGWGWGECYDGHDSAELETRMKTAHELPASVAIVLYAAAIVAQHRGEELLAANCAGRARECSEQRSSLVVRDGFKAESILRRRLLMRLGLATVFMTILAALPLPPVAIGVGALVLVVGSFMSWRQYRHRCERFRRQAAGNAFRVAGCKASRIAIQRCP
jgi:hypothetical protein